MASKIALSIIAKNEEKTIAQTITSVIPEVDAVFVLDTGSKDKTVKIARSLGARVDEVGDRFLETVTKEDEKWVKDYLGPNSFLKAGDKIFNFSEARNYGLSLISRDYAWVLWLDGDDVFKGKDNLRKIVEKADAEGVDSLFMTYFYNCEFNPDGSVKRVILQHKKERLFRNNGAFKWVARIHENIVPQRPVNRAECNNAYNVHLQNREEVTQAIHRNIKNLEYEVCKTDGEDPRPIYYLAKSYVDLQDPKYLPDALRLLKGYHKGSGWAEERGEAWEYVATIHQRLGNYNNAIKACFNALIEDPTYPNFYVNLAHIYLSIGDWQKALFWVKLAAQVEQPNTTLIVNQIDLMTKSLEIIYKASLNLNQLDQAWAAMHKLLEMWPDDEGAKKEWALVDELKKEKELTVKAVDIARYLKNTGQDEKIKLLIQSLPQEVASNQIITRMYQQVCPARKHEDNEISIFLGPTFEVWGPKTIEERGSGGSEEAVYRLSKELTQIGYKVTVYANPGVEHGINDGVDYKNYYEMNWQDEFNILITWRQPALLDENIKSKRHYLWLHDVPNIKEFTQNRVENVDKVIALSRFHASLLEPTEMEGEVYGVVPEKLLISRNGVSI